MENQLSITPGEWKIRYGHEIYVEGKEYPKTIAVCRFKHNENPVEAKEAEANTRLMAVAPEMFKILSFISENNGTQRVNIGYDLHQMIDLVIKKVSNGN